MFSRDSHSQKLQQRQEEMRQVREEIERRQEENYTQKEHNNGNLIKKTYSLLSSQCSTTGVTRKEGNVLFNDALKTFYLRLYGVGHMVKDHHPTDREMFYLMTHSTHFIYGYKASDIWLRTILIVRKETRCRHIGYSYRLAARVLLYAPSHRQDNTYHGLCYTRGSEM